jgi:hypothetical protein
MKKRLTIEVFFILGVASLTLLVGLILFQNKLFDGKDLDLQLHDTYIILPKTFLLLAVFATLLVLVNLARAVYHKLNNKLVNIILGPYLSYL